MFVSSSDWPKLLEADHLACYSEDSCGSIFTFLVLRKLKKKNISRIQLILNSVLTSERGEYASKHFHI